jgi:hypothetical protein
MTLILLALVAFCIVTVVMYFFFKARDRGTAGAGGRRRY